MLLAPMIQAVVSLVLLFLPLTVSGRATNDTLKSVKQAFINSGLVPEVLPKFDPVLLLDTTYIDPQTGEVKSVSPPGSNFTRPETKNRPTWSIPTHHKKLAHETFVIAMVDPDAPTPQHPTVSQIRHFLGGGFKLAVGPHPKGAGIPLVNNTPALSDYRQPTPPNTSDPHRYVFLLYRQPLDFPTTISPNITHFNISAFAKQFGLGPPLAGNFLTVSTKPTNNVTH